MAESSVKVFVRVRPLAPSRRSSGSISSTSTSTSSSTGTAAATPPADSMVSVIDNTTVVIPGNAIDETMLFPFDKVFDTDSSQKDVYSAVCNLVQEVRTGKNATIFAYGQTGAGKTHSILGTKSDPGILPRMVEDLIKCVVSEDKGIVLASWLEVYNEKLFDLKNRKANLDIYGDRTFVKVQGLTSVNITSLEQFRREHDTAWKARATAATKLNDNSSRSHFILQLQIEIKKEGKILKSKLNICDLAGSENNKKTGNEGMRMNESRAINKSLFELGRVVEALNQRQSNVIYRNSNLTRLLQDALGGSAVAVVLACIAGNDYMETLSTLKFGAKCGNIKNQVVINEIALPPPPPPIQPPRSKTPTELALHPRRYSDENSMAAKRQKISSNGGLYSQAKRVAIKCPDAGTENQDVESKIIGTAISMKNNLKQRLQDLETKLANSQQQQQQQQQQQEDPKTQLENLQKKTEIYLVQLLNTGTLQTLKKLKTVGAVRAGAMLKLREEIGEFKSIHDLKPILKPSQIENLCKSNIDVSFL